MTRTIKGRRVCATVYDARGTAHLLDPRVSAPTTVCGRPVTEAGRRNGRSCGWCAEGAASANRAVRGLPGSPPGGKVLAWLVSRLES